MMTSLKQCRLRRDRSGRGAKPITGRLRRAGSGGSLSHGALLLALACLLVPGMATQGIAEASVAPARRAGAKPQPQPLPIAGGMQLPGGPFLHVHAPGPDGQTLPVSGFPYEGLNADPSTIGSFKGFVALAYVAGEATGSDGKQYLLETDMRVFKGTYRTADGAEHRGVFGFI